jgi:hypothetical protein
MFYEDLDQYGATRELRVYGMIHGTPPPLKKICRTAILNGLGSNPRTKIKALPLQLALKSYIAQSTDRVCLNLDAETKEVYSMPNMPNKSTPLVLLFKEKYASPWLMSFLDIKE